MKRFASCWPDYSIVQQAVAQIPWRSNIVFMDKLNNTDSRIWYAEKLLEKGWRSNILELMIEGKLIDRQGAAVINFNKCLADDLSIRTGMIRGNIRERVLLKNL
jgi:hypothetical protein